MHNGELPPLPRRAAHRPPAPGQPAHAARPGRHRLPGTQPFSGRAVFASTEFRALWSAQALSSAGDQLAQVTIGFVVYANTGSPFLAALAYALTYLPAVLGGPALAGLADGFPRQQVMIVLDLARAGLVALMALPGMPIPGLATLFFGIMLLGAPFATARAGLLTEVLPRAMRPAGLAIGNQTAQLGQIAGLLAGGGLVAALGPYRALALDSLSFSLSAGILACWVPARPAPPPGWRDSDRGRLAAADVTWAGVATIFGTPGLRALVLFGWLAGFTVVPEGLAAPYAHTLGGGAPTIGLLLAAAPAGLLIGAFVLGRLVRPADRLRPIGWLAMLSCAPLVFCQVHPPVLVVAALWAVAGAGGAYQLAAAAVFVRAVPRADQGRAFAVAQSGLLTAQVLGLLAAGAAANRLGPQAAVALAGLLGLVTAAALATGWARRHAELLVRLDGALPEPASHRPEPIGSPHLLTGPPHRPAGVPPHRAGAPHRLAGPRQRRTGRADRPDRPPDASTQLIGRPAQPLDRRTQPLGRTGQPPGRWDQLIGPGAAVPSRRARVPSRRTHLPGRRAQLLGGRHAHRAPRDLPGEARLAARLLDQVLGDRRAFPFFRDDDPPGQVDQRAHAECDHRNSHEDEPDQGGVDAGILGDPGADTGHQPAVPRPD